MQDFFVIGCEDPSLVILQKLGRMPGFKGVVLPEGKTIRNRHIPPVSLSVVNDLKKVSLGDFFLYTKRHPGVILVSLYDFPAGWKFTKKLEASSQGKFKLYDRYNFCLDNNIPIIFVPAKEERDIICGAKKEWAEFRRHLTDDFSRFTLDCYLAACEKKDLSLMFPAYMGFENIYFNRVSRKIGMVPGPDEIYVDVGALDGDTVTGFVDCAGTYRAIHAYEPMKTVFNDLKKREFYLDNFFPKNVAVSNRNGMIDFIMDSNILSGRAVNEFPRVYEEKIESMPCVKLDDEIDEATLLKIEVEGHEPAVIEGAAHLIKKCTPEMIVQAYHYPLDPIRILEAVEAIHKYKHIAFRFYDVGLHISSMLFSDRAPFL